MAQGDRATMHTRQVLDFGIRSTLADRFGRTNVTIMDECFAPVDIALGLKKRSPLRCNTQKSGSLISHQCYISSVLMYYRILLNGKIQQLKEGGLVSKWLRDGAESSGRLLEDVDARTREAR